MVGTEYAIAYKEIFEILKYIPLSYYEKIPSKVINLITSNADMNYEFSYDSKKTFDEQNISACAKEILAIIYINYWARSNQKEKIMYFQNMQRQLTEKEKIQKYSIDNIFAKKRLDNKIVIDEQLQTSLIENKENFSSKIKRWFFRIFKNKNK